MRDEQSIHVHPTRLGAGHTLARRAGLSMHCLRREHQIQEWQAESIRTALLMRTCSKRAVAGLARCHSIQLYGGLTGIQEDDPLKSQACLPAKLVRSQTARHRHTEENGLKLLHTHL